MEITVLFIQRKESYEGEYAPEALIVADEYTMDDNPEFFDEEVKRILEEDSDISGHTIVLFEVDQDLIRSLCFNRGNKIQATIINKEES
jgi:hypothetical protein